MPILEIAGQQVEVGDDFLKLPPDQQQATVNEIAASLKPASASKVGLTDVARSAATGVPILGGLANKANAATAALLSPLIEPLMGDSPENVATPGSTIGERYSKSLAMQEARDAKFAKEHPIVDTAAKVTGGVVGTLPLVMAAPAAFGVTGTLPAQILKGGSSSAALSAADAGVRGEDVVHGAVVGGGLGMGAPVVAKGIGKVIQAVRPAPAAVPQHTVRVGDVDVPVRPDHLSGDPAAAAERELELRGVRGDRAQAEAQGFQTQTKDALQQATDDLAAKLDPTGAVLKRPATAAGEAVSSELAAAEAQRVASEQAALQRTAQEADRLRAAGQSARTVDSPYGAAEAVGAGVEAREAAATGRTKAAYGALEAEPGAFEPATVTGMGASIRERLAADPSLIVNPQSAATSHQALTLLDSVDGTGLFRNTAPRPPVGPVAEAAAAAGKVAPLEGETAVKALIAQGVNPEVARAAIARELGQAAPVRGGGAAIEQPGTMAAHEVATADGKAVRVVPKVVEASDLRTSADAGYPAALQPRNRGRAASDMQVQDMARNLNPRRLGASTEADRGAPIVGADGLVESGNGRTLAIRQAYAENGPAAARYREWLTEQGVDVSKYREPVLVRERATPMSPDQRKAFTVSANQAATMSMSAPERALADSRILSPEVLTLIRNPADLAAAENRDFVRAFMNGIPATERAALMTKNGELSAEGVTRMRNAVLGKAYGDSPILSRIAESTHDEVRSISNGLVAAAPEWAQLRARIHSGDVPAHLDVTGDLVDAVSRTAAIRGRGVGLETSKAQADAFTKQSAESEAIQRLFYDADGKRAASAPKIGEALGNYAREAAKVDASPGLMLGLPDVTAADILKGVAGKVGAPTALAKEVVEAAAPAATGPQIGEVGLREMEAARKRLTAMYGDAKRAALAPGGSPNDMRVMGRILREFDNSILEAFENGRFSGDSERAAELLRTARASHAAYRESFASRGPGDTLGRKVEQILGRYHDTKATPDQIAAMSYGSHAEPGGGDVAQVAQRIKTIVGESSPEYGAYKQGLMSHLLDTPAGKPPLSNTAMADRIERFLDGSKGRILAETALTPADRAALRTHAANLRASEPVPVSSLNSVEKVMARVSGRDGSAPMSPGEVLDLVLGRNMRTNKALGVPVAQALKRALSPESWDQLRLALFKRVSEARPGQPAFEAQAMSTRLHDLLELDVARVYFSPAEREHIRQLASAYKQMVPPKGTTNPSGTNAALQRTARGMMSNVMAMLGGVHGGFTGMAVGHAADKVAGRIADSRNVRRAIEGSYGKQPKIPASSPKSLIVLSQASAPVVARQ